MTGRPLASTIPFALCGIRNVTASTEEFSWTTQAEPFARVVEFVRDVSASLPFVADLERRLQQQTGTRLVDWVDRIGTSAPEAFEAVGYQQTALGAEKVWQHPAAMLPILFRTDRDTLALKVESVSAFLLANGFDERIEIVGEPHDEIRRARVSENESCECHVVERHGTLRWNAGPTGSPRAITLHAERLRLRQRDFETLEEGFARAEALFQAAANDVGTNRACELFFAAERDYWQSRNHAGRVQKSRQDRLGLGWANHDHHTYRSSRAAFPHLIRILEVMGFSCRERFYAGADAGWGAQVLEQPDCGLTVFADVDLSPDEIAGDFAHSDLPPQDVPGTVGLWCALHGEAFLEAGMHHLECQFDFDAAREQLAEVGIESMAPFTDFPHLRQAFTVGERWSVSESRLEAAIAAGQITTEDATRFRSEGVIGSHLEILERNDGYKGFNKTGISEIILETNPRTAK